MARTSSGRWLNRFIWFTAVATLLLICSGGMVTSKGVGLAVPDWPTTFGYNMFLFPVSKWVGGIFFEHTHRLAASTVGFLTVILAIWLWRDEGRPWVRRLGIVALGAVILQGILGGLRVTLLKDQIGVFHACLAQAFFGLLIFIGVVRTELWCRGSLGSVDLMRQVARVALIGTILIYGQMVLGATMRHQHKDLSILDFPTAYQQWWPDTSAGAIDKINAWRDARALSDVTPFQIWLQMAHRFGAVLAAAAVIAARAVYRRGGEGSSILSRLLFVWLIGVFAQITLGAWTIWSNKAADIATAHVALGAVMFVLGVAITSFAVRFSGKPVTARIGEARTGAAVLA